MLDVDSSWVDDDVGSVVRCPGDLKRRRVTAAQEIRDVDAEDVDRVGVEIGPGER